MLRRRPEGSAARRALAAAGPGAAAAFVAVAAAFLAAALLAPLPAAAQDAANPPVHPAGKVVLDTGLYSGLKYRMIGPYRGGRVTAVSGVPGSDGRTFYMGATGGGVWKTTNAGISWTNVSDGAFAVGSIGSIAVAPSDSQVVYVGTGSWAWRGNVSTGKGIYRSDDGGKSWRFLGLASTGSIGALAVDPRDPDRVFAAALGHPFGANSERGVYRTEDGGRTWEKVLFVSDSTGFADLSMDPSNPRVVYAAGWRAERKPWTIVDGAREGGIWKTTDGGDHWQRLSGGLPDGLLGKIGVDVSPADPDRVYALVVAKDPDGGIWRSDDAGRSWSHVNSEHKLTQRGWYYARIIADPKDPNTVYAPNVRFWRSVDGGRRWERIRTRHGDDHSLWIQPSDPDVMIEGNDGGANISNDGGRTWSSLHNQPTAQIYRVFVDDRFPYRVYGPQQDLGTISVPAWAPGTGEVTPQGLWRTQGGGESGWIAFDPDHPAVTYAGSYMGVIDRMDHETGRSRNMIVYPQLSDGVAPKDLKYRFQWNAPIVKSRFDTSVVYHAAQYVLKTTDGGRTWSRISPDLTRGDTTREEIPGGPVQHDHTGVEIYGTIFALAEGARSADVLWAGSDDGLVHLTRDGGKTWKDVTPPG
ncbi:MAG TPA: glycosyl hydrolase, partial [Gemmatimonadota bacterium]|nr:glycosyl hydrolase [Gemmatimonadota bacterium]